MRQVAQTFHHNAYTETTQPFSIRAVAAAGWRVTQNWHIPLPWRYASGAISIGGFERQIAGGREHKDSKE